MSAPTRREVACAILLDTSGHLLLQQRDNVPGIVHPGKIGLFGGHREGDETFTQCVVREIHEELSYFVPAERFEHLVSYEGVDPEVSGSHLRAALFVARDIPHAGVVVTEGSLRMCKLDELGAIESKLTPLALFALRAFARDAGKR